MRILFPPKSLQVIDIVILFNICLFDERKRQCVVSFCISQNPDKVGTLFWFIVWVISVNTLPYDFLECFSY